MTRLLSSIRKEELKNSANAIFVKAEQLGLFPRASAFERDFAGDYPELARLSDHHAVIRDECLELLSMHERLVDVEALADDYTRGGIHAIKWKSFMFKSGAFLEENCRLAPRTAALLRGVPGMYTAFFSILDPKQYVTPHWGYWKGFLRYHLGVVIPNDNADRSCWLRVNSDPLANALRDETRVADGEKYYWRNGEGVMFDDTFLHDAMNGSDAVRVVLWVDVRRTMPTYLQALNTLFLEVAHQDPSVARIRRNAIVRA